MDTKDVLLQSLMNFLMSAAANTSGGAIKNKTTPNKQLPGYLAEVCINQLYTLH